nr:MAG TPA: hypothetical protein [Caudoviricetes sp.]
MGFPTSNAVPVPAARFFHICSHHIVCRISVSLVATDFKLWGCG